ncbi:putative clathrin assembly protein [Vitis vinifera]|uniref:Putative clathrin assembly protein n=1 Tax=Vitis vinifera TaxID=29760 RepID=A0A438JU40_VITVI|nr:putative clathrin assembly protein [Vitis vinifera]
MATLQTWRKAYGALKDSTKVGLAHVNSDFADLDVAVVKATNHVECPPKERHIRSRCLLNFGRHVCDQATSRCCLLHSCALEAIGEDA